MATFGSFLDDKSFENLKEPHKYFRLSEKVGGGTYGQVYRGLHIQSKFEVAIKILKVREKYIYENKKELEFLRKYSNHTNICKFYGAYISKDPRAGHVPDLWIVMELCGGGTVTQLVKSYTQKRKRLRESWCVYIIKGVILGLDYLHSNGVIHRDIKSQNIMLNKDGVIKLVDFGVSAQLSRDNMMKKTMIGTPYWMAPEVILCSRYPGMSYDWKCDIWSVGITAIELADGFPPLTNIHPNYVLKAITERKPPKLKNSRGRTSNYSKFISSCLQRDPKSRPDAKKLLETKLILKLSKKEPEVLNALAKYIQRL